MMGLHRKNVACSRIQPTIGVWWSFVLLSLKVAAFGNNPFETIQLLLYVRVKNSGVATLGLNPTRFEVPFDIIQNV